MQSWYAERFEREMSCTVAVWRANLPGACRHWPLALGCDSAHVCFEPGILRLRWAGLPDLRIALLRMPRLQVYFEFEQVGEPARHEFMHYFDLYMLRGGG